jgi:hypothetical protein
MQVPGSGNIACQPLGLGAHQPQHLNNNMLALSTANTCKIFHQKIFIRFLLAKFLDSGSGPLSWLYHIPIQEGKNNAQK